jgi:hypothetical protein
MTLSVTLGPLGLADSSAVGDRPISWAFDEPKVAQKIENKKICEIVNIFS